MKKVKYLAVITLTILSGALYAQQGNGSRGEGRQNREFNGRNHAGLDLNDEQQAKADELRLTMQKAALPIRNEIGENRAKLRTLTTADNPDMKAINKLIDANAGLEANLRKIQAANHQEFRKILTEEQRLKFDSQQGQRHARGKNFGDRGQGQRGQQKQFKGQREE